MEAGKIMINGIFNGSRLLTVPFFQRSYVWETQQWERFLLDMEMVTKTGKSFFLGPVIMKAGEKPPTWACYADCKTVIDGQQRLTTMLIFLKVIALKTQNSVPFDKYFRLEDGSIALHHGKNDREAFKIVMNLTEAEKIPNKVSQSQIIEAYNYFIDYLDPEKVNQHTIRQCVQFVCIDLLEDEDEQQVFDTVNSPGAVLTTADMLKNYFYREENIAEYERDWVGIFENDRETKVYWDQKFETGRIIRLMIDIFFDAYFQLFLLDKRFSVSTEERIVYSRTNQLAKSYKDFIRKQCGGDKSVILSPMADYARCFAETFRPEFCKTSLPNTKGIERLNVVIFGLKTTTLIPYVLFVAHNVSDEVERNRIYGILEAYIMRRIVVHATTKNYNRVFDSLILNRVLDAYTLLQRLSKDPDATTYVPDNAELLRGFQQSKLVNLQSRGILYLIESGIRSPFSSTALYSFNTYSLEHLMPKKWTNNWPACASDEEEQQRNRKLLTLGNLAIIPMSLNASIRDGNWQTKLAGKGNKTGLAACAAGLRTVQDVLQTEVWNEEAIDQRAVWLYEQARLLWKL